MPNLPKDVERYVKEHIDQGQPEDKAWAIAWSRYCKYKNPGSDHCRMPTSDYFPGQNKQAQEIESLWQEMGYKSKL